MSLISTNKLGALALIAGPTLALAMFLLQPGGQFIQTADPSDAVGSIAAWTDNGALTRITAALIAVGLMGMAFGIYEVHVAHRGSRGDGLTMAGLAFFTLCVAAWVFGHALTATLSAIAMPPDAQTAVYGVRLGLIIAGGLAGCAGIFLFSIGVIIDSGGRLFLILSGLAALSAVVGAIGWIVASGGSDLDSGMQLARSVYIVWVVWMVVLGVRLAREESAES